MIRTILAVGLAAIFASSAVAADPLGTTINRKIRDEGPWYTPSEAAFIRERCGFRSDAEIRNIDIEGDVMTCNGRRVQSPEVKRISQDVSRRAHERVAKVMNDPEVKAAMRNAAEIARRRALAQPR